MTIYSRVVHNKYIVLSIAIVYLLSCMWHCQGYHIRIVRNHVVGMLSHRIKSVAIPTRRFNSHFDAAVVAIAPRVAIEEAARFNGEYPRFIGYDDDLRTMRKLPKELAVRICVDNAILKALSMSQSKRKVRALISFNDASELSIDRVRNLIERKIPELANVSYSLRYKEHQDLLLPRLFNSDEDVYRVLQKSKEERSVVHLIVRPELNNNCAESFFKETYLQGMPDPLDADSFTILSFYRFGTTDPVEFAEQLRHLWKPLMVFGRVYVADEGINAQMAIPTNVLPNFRLACETVPLLKNLYLNVDHTMSKNDFEAFQPFSNLHIRIRPSIVTDGLDYKLDTTKQRTELPPTEWHEAITRPEALILDCRNSYESDVGRFANAVPLQTSFFRESWSRLESILRDVPKDKPLLTYCTGGIRCVKVNAFLEDKMGFTNVASLKGGIISYTKEMEQRGQHLEQTTTEISSSTHSSPHLDRHVDISRFHGTNYVFDHRMCASITDEELGTCETCGHPCNTFFNCDNSPCHVRFIQCKTCSGSYSGCCSMYCQQSKEESIKKKIANKAMTPRQPINTVKIVASTPRDTKTTSPASVLPDVSSSSFNAVVASIPDIAFPDSALTDYCERLSYKESDTTRAIREASVSQFPHAIRMLSDPIQGRLLTSLASLRRCSSVLELGTFTGYSTVCLAEGLSSKSENPPSIITCDIDAVAPMIAKKYLGDSPLADKIKFRTGDGMQLLQEMAESKKSFEMVFIDADKKSYKAYVDKLTSTSEDGFCLLEDGALLVVDNTLWKGLVLDADSNECSYSDDSQKPDRIQRLAATMHDFNRYLLLHPNLRPLLIPMRDGLTLCTFHRLRKTTD